MRKSVIFGFLVVLLLTSTVWAKVGGGDITFSAKGQGNVLFSHDTHVGQKGLKCAECHRQYPMTKVDTGAKMEDMRKEKYCGVCHNDRRAFGVKAHCERCHGA